MNNQKSLLFFENLANSEGLIPGLEKLAHKNDWSSIDAEFILKYSQKNFRVLDIGTGTGLIINKLYDKVGTVTCVEPYTKFTKFVTKSPNIRIINENIFNFETEEKFDLITAFGVMHYFNEEEATQVYGKLITFLRHGCRLILKNQFGIKDDVTVAGYSEEQKADYFSQYRCLKKEIEILENVGFKNIETIDIYPPEANRWNNTHFYSIVGEK